MAIQEQNPELPGEQQQELEKDLFERANRIKPKDEDQVMSQFPGKLAEVVDSVHKKTPTVKRLIHNVQELYEMLRDRSYSLSWSVKAIILAGLLYFISPVDLIPDFIPLLGYIDDAFVISAVLNSITAELERYREFKKPL